MGCGAGGGAAPHLTVPAERLEDLTAAFADFVDLKSPFLLGHSSRVGRMAAAAEAAALAAAEVAVLRQAGRLHDLGRLSVANSVWDKAGPLSAAQWERVRLHPYYSERVLSASPVLARLGRLVGAHHERLDGSGYYRGSSGSALPLAARFLAAADALAAMTEPRGHRPARPMQEAAAELAAGANAGLFDRDAVAAVCQVAGVPVVVRSNWPAGLTDREVEVLRLLARGAPRKQVARRLGIGVGTVHTHISHIYEKIGVNSVGGGRAGVLRAGVALLAGQVIAPALAAFHADYPGVVLDRTAAVSERLLAQVSDGSLHVAFVHQVPALATFPRVDWEVVRRGRLAVVVSRRHPLAGRASVALGQLRAETFLANPRELAPAALQGLKLMCAEFGGFDPHVMETEAASTATLDADWHPIRRRLAPHPARHRHRHHGRTDRARALPGGRRGGPGPTAAPVRRRRRLAARRSLRAARPVPPLRPRLPGHPRLMRRHPALITRCTNTCGTASSRPRFLDLTNPCARAVLRRWRSRRRGTR